MFSDTEQSVTKTRTVPKCWQNK